MATLSNIIKYYVNKSCTFDERYIFIINDVLILLCWHNIFKVLLQTSHYSIVIGISACGLLFMIYVICREIGKVLFIVAGLSLV